MASKSISTKRLMSEKQKMEQNPSDTFIALPTHQNLFEWHFVLFNFSSGSPYEGGQFHGIINIPSDYPLRPPAIKFVTPNGRFAVGEKINLSFTNYHPETWSSKWTIASMLTVLVSFMCSNTKIVGGVDSNNIQKQEHAKKSINRNLQNQQFVEYFTLHFDKLGINQNLENDNLLYEDEIEINLLEKQKEEQVVNHNNINIIADINNNINNNQNNNQSININTYNTVKQLIILTVILLNILILICYAILYGLI